MKSNIEMVKNYLEGVRPVPIFGYEAPIEETHKIGETWSDDKGYVYEKKNGYTIKCTRMGNIIRESSEKKVCQDCGLDPLWTNDKKNKIINIENRCYDCYLKFESKLRVQGKFPDFQKKRIIQSQKSYLLDIKVKLEESIKYLENEKVIKFVNSNGMVEEWPIENKEEMLDVLVSDLNICEENIKEADILLKELSLSLTQI